MKERELSDDAPCGCGSSETYGKCCKSLSARFLINKKGRVTKVITPPASGIKALEDAEEAFRLVFGRKQRREDLILLAGLRHSPRDYKRNFRKICIQAETPKHIAYAIEETGLFVSSDNYYRLSPKDRQDWDDAVGDYLEAEEDGVDLLNPPSRPVEAATAFAKQVMNDATTHLGSYLNRRPSATKSKWRIFAQYLLMVKCFWHVKCLADRWDEITRTETAALARGIYECSLLIGSITADSSFSDTLQAQSLAGSDAFPYRRKADSSIDFSKIVCTETGKIYPSRSSFKDCSVKIGEGHDELFNRIYPLLSNQVHFDTMSMISNLRKSGSFLMWDDGEKDNVAIISLATLLYLLIALLNVKGVQAVVRRDMAFLATRASDAIDKLVDAFNEEGRWDKNVDGVLEALFNIKAF